MELSEKLWRETPKSDCTCCFLVMAIAAAASATMVVVVVVMVVMLMMCRRWEDDGGIGGFTRFCTSYLMMMPLICVCAWNTLPVPWLCSYFILLTVSGPVYYSNGCCSMSFYICLCQHTYAHNKYSHIYLASTQPLSLPLFCSYIKRMTIKKRCPKRVFKNGTKQAWMFLDTVETRQPGLLGFLANSFFNRNAWKTSVFGTSNFSEILICGCRLYRQIFKKNQSCWFLKIPNARPERLV